MAPAQANFKRKPQPEDGPIEPSTEPKKQKVINASNDDGSDDGSSSSEDDLGPSLPPASSKSSTSNTAETANRKKTKKKHTTRRSQKSLDAALSDKIFLNNLPDFPFYNLTFAHREQVTLIKAHQQPISLKTNGDSSAAGGTNKQSEFIVTGSKDGRVMFWNKLKSTASNSAPSNGQTASQEPNDTIGKITFVKEFKAHSGSVVDAALSPDGRYLATISGIEHESLPGGKKITDTTVKIFDVVSFDMIYFFQLAAPPRCICWGSAAKTSGTPKLLIGLQNDSNIYIHDPASDTPEKPKYVLSHLHKKPVKLIAYNAVFGVAVSVDDVGMVEYWTPDPSNVGFGSRSTKNNEELFARPTGGNWFELKSSTNLYDFRKSKSIPTSITISPNGKMFATFSLPDRKVRVFDFVSGKLLREYDESLETIADFRRLQGVGKAEKEETDIAMLEKMDDDLFEQKMEREKSIADSKDGLDMTRCMNVLFDAASRFIIYSSPVGIKFVNVKSNKLIRTLGTGEHNLRFLNLALYQGFNRPSDSGRLTVEAAASDNAIIQKSLVPDPVIFATALDSPRFYLFSRVREVDHSEEDVTGEADVETVNGVKLRPPRNVKQWLQDRPIPTNHSVGGVDVGNTLVQANSKSKTAIPEALNVRAATLHTTLGDIRITFFPDVAPLAVENFVTLCRRKYYDGTTFHRVIKGFMIQGGDPLGDGTGGESMWANASYEKTYKGVTGGTWGDVNFKDEFDPTGKISHDRALRVSMANAGPGTNGSQFFITTVATPFLDKKHTIFGTVEMGADTVSVIENLETDKKDRPRVRVEIVSVTVT